MIDSGTFVETIMIAISKKQLDKMPYSTRRKNAKGWFEGLIPGTRGGLWWVKHCDGSLSSYLEEEVIVINKNTWGD
jgi:hypothetical protein